MALVSVGTLRSCFLGECTDCCGLGMLFHVTEQSDCEAVPLKWVLFHVKQHAWSTDVNVERATFRSLRWVTGIGLIGYAEPIAVLRNLNCAVLRVTFNLGSPFPLIPLVLGADYITEMCRPTVARGFPPQDRENLSTEITKKAREAFGMRTANLGFVFLSVVTAVVSGFGQSTPVVTGAGYTSPAPVNVAPGQILTVLVQGIGGTLTQPVRPSGNTLPTSLAGISATLQQGSNRSVGIVDVRPVSTCGPPSLAGSGQIGRAHV